MLIISVICVAVVASAYLFLPQFKTGVHSLAVEVLEQPPLGRAAHEFDGESTDTEPPSRSASRSAAIPPDLIGIGGQRPFTQEEICALRAPQKDYYECMNDRALSQRAWRHWQDLR